MTFKHKLAKRLATLWGLAALACTPGDMALAPADPSVALAASQILLQESFEDNAFASRGWYDNPAMATTTAQHIPGSARALEVHFPAGANNPTWGGAARRLFASTPTLYVSYWVKYSGNWVGSGRAYHPHEFMIMSDQDGDWDGLSNSWLATYIESNYQNGGIPRLQLQDNKAINTSNGGLPVNLVNVTENRSTSGCNGVVESNVVTTCFNMPPWYNDKEISAGQVWFKPNPGPGYKGDWNHVEVYLQLNSVLGGRGVADGVMQYWFNGTPVIDRHDILYRTAARPNLQFHQFVIAPYIGDGSPVDQYMWVDDLVVATSRDATEPPGGSVATVTVSPSSGSIASGSTVQLTATPRDALGTGLTGRTVTWASSNSGAATVSASGLVTGVATGSATITATSEGKSGTAAITVTAPAVTTPGTVTDLAVASVTSTSATLSFTEVTNGAGLPASYLVRFAVAPLSWGSATEVALGTCKVPLAGTAVGAKRSCTVTGLAASTAYQFQLVAFRGTLNMNAVFGGLSNVASRTTAATTTAPVASVVVSPVSASLAVGATRQLTVTLQDAAGTTLTGRTVTWASSNSGVATVSASGLVTGVATGSATITATSEGIGGTAAITVTAPVVTNPGTVGDLAVASVTSTSATLSFTEVTNGAGLPASYLVRFAVAPLSWGSATEVALGTCRVPLAGTAIGAKRTCTVTGLAAFTSYQFQLVAFRGTMNVNAVFGGLSNVASGTTAATTTAPVATVAVSPVSASLAVGATRQLTAALKDAAGNTLTGRTVTWASSNRGVATVSASGLVTGVATGSATITATSEGIGGTAAITVTAPVVTNPGTVGDLAVASVTSTSATLSFTEVTNGAGLPASYLVRFAVAPLSWGSATEVSLGTCKVPLAGTAIGAKRTCTVTGLAASTGHQFQLVAYRGTLNVNAVFGGLSNVASRTTASSTAPVASVTVNPASTSLSVGATQQATATLKDANGSTLTGRSVTWVSNSPAVATVSSAGLVTGVASGSSTVTAMSEGMSGTSAITVATTPPPPSAGTWPNEPAGFRLLSDYGFTDPIPMVNDGPVGSSGWKILNPDNGQPLVAGRAVSAVDPTAPLGPTIAQFIYPVGMRDGWAPATMYYANFSTTEFYAGFWWKPSNPWQSDNSGVNKIAFLFGGPAQIYISMNRSGSTYHLRVEDEINGATNYDPNVTMTPITLGQWHRVEWYVSTTGGFKFWLDGVLQGSYPGVRWSNPFFMFQFSPTWGGNGGDVKQQLDTYSYNRVRLSQR